jgi:drug/metabolite transporter (DMT)-like permease
MFMGGAVLLLLSIISGERFDFDSVSAESWFGFVYLIIFGSLIGFSAFTWLISNAPISLVATYSFVNPVVAVAIGVLLLGEGFGPNILVGGSVVLAGVALAVIAEKPAKPE